MNTSSRAAKVLKAMGHPVRLEMVRGLAGDGCNVNKIVRTLGLPQSTVSQHLNVLKAAGIIRGEREGVRICYRVIDKLALSILDLM
ncbi:MAG TPA: metalloregulator ArsR/SmtB family transcription factor [Candidatus Omnitrophota bacterium]|nr:metalloregulator ArsR/SmtB family transcription factor [Candidatus Omnitrophota bacterium]